MPLGGNQGSGVRMVKLPVTGVGELESMLSDSPSVDRVCVKLGNSCAFVAAK
jgi:hypothetical protein